MAEYPDVSKMSAAEAVAWFTGQVRDVARMHPLDPAKARRAAKLLVWKETVLNPHVEACKRALR